MLLSLLIQLHLAVRLQTTHPDNCHNKTLESLSRKPVWLSIHSCRNMVVQHGGLCERGPTTSVLIKGSLQGSKNHTNLSLIKTELWTSYYIYAPQIPLNPVSWWLNMFHNLCQKSKQIHFEFGIDLLNCWQQRAWNEDSSLLPRITDLELQASCERGHPALANFG